MLIPSIHLFFYLSTALLKSNVFGTQKPIPPTVFDLQASDWVRCEEKTSAYYRLSRITYKFASFFFIIIKVAFFSPKKYEIFKKIHKIYN